MKKTNLLLSVLFPVMFSGCSMTSWIWGGDEELKQASFTRCKIKLNNQKTYWSRFEDGSIYLYDRAGNRCLLRVISNPVQQYETNGRSKKRQMKNTHKH